MPVSDLSNIVPILSKVWELKPKTVVDLGCGFGKYGVLCREVLDAQYGRLTPDKWQVHIAGVEGFKGYNNPVWGAYDVVYTKDIRDYIQLSMHNDVALLIDCLEHFERKEAMKVLYELAENTDHIIYSVPIGECPQGAVFGNQLEEHKVSWTGVTDLDLRTLPSTLRDSAVTLHKGVCHVVYMKGLSNANV